MGLCLGKPAPRSKKHQGEEVFPVTFTETQICDYYVDQLPSRLQGEGIHLLRGGPGPIVQGWTHELLNESGVHTFQDRELLLKCRDRMTAAVERHRERRRQLNLPCRGSMDGPHRASRTGKRAPSLDLTDQQHRPSESAPASPAGSLNGAASAHVDITEPTSPASRPQSLSGAASDCAAAPDVAAAPEPEVVDKAAAAAAAAAALAAAAEAAAANTASFLDTDGKPFRLTSDWLPAGVPLYRISEERGLKYGVSSVMDASTTARHHAAVGAETAHAGQPLTVGGDPDHMGDVGAAPQETTRTTVDAMATVAEDAAGRGDSDGDGDGGGEGSDGGAVAQDPAGGQQQAEEEEQQPEKVGEEPAAESPCGSEPSAVPGAAGDAPSEPTATAETVPASEGLPAHSSSNTDAQDRGSAAKAVDGEAHVEDARVSTAAAAEAAPAAAAVAGKPAPRSAGGEEDGSGSGSGSCSGSRSTSRSLATDSIGALNSLAGATSWAPSAASSSPVPAALVATAAALATTSGASPATDIPSSNGGGRGDAARDRCGAGEKVIGEASGGGKDSVVEACHGESCRVDAVANFEEAAQGDGSSVAGQIGQAGPLEVEQAA